MPSHDTAALLARIEQLEAARRDSARRWRRGITGLVLVAGALPLAAQALAPVPNLFVSGGTISAAEMNANFDYLEEAITDVEAVVPSGAVMFFDLSTCPAGWSEETAIRGRTIVGMPGSAGTLAGTVGTAFGDLENRSHTHAVDPASAGTALGGAHNHEWLRDGNSTYDTAGVRNVSVPSLSLGVGTVSVAVILPAGANDFFTSNAASHTHSVDLPSTDSSPASTSDVTPYVQYLACVRD